MSSIPDEFLTYFMTLREEVTAIEEGTNEGLKFEIWFKENIMKTYDGRPHWGKMHTRTSEDLSPLYPEWNKFQLALERLDPDGHFSTPYLDRVLRS